MDYACRTERLLFSAWPREAVVVGPLREGEGVKAGPLRKKNFFSCSPSIIKHIFSNDFTILLNYVVSWQSFFCQHPFSAILRQNKVPMNTKLEGGRGGLRPSWSDH